MLGSKTIWGALLAVLGYLLQPQVLAVLPEKVSAILTATGVVLGAIGVRHAITKNGTGQ